MADQVQPEIKKPNKVLLFLLGIVFTILFLILIIFLISIGAIVFIFIFAFVLLAILLRLFIRYFKYILIGFIALFVVGAIILFTKNYYDVSVTNHLNLYVYIGLGVLIISLIAIIFYQRSKRVEILLPARYIKREKSKK
jgi:membrane-bound ClpP family serine protease